MGPRGVVRVQRRGWFADDDSGEEEEEGDEEEEEERGERGVTEVTGVRVWRWREEEEGREALASL